MGVNIIKFYNEQTKADYFMQFTQSNFSNLSLMVVNIVDTEIVPFICNLGDTLADTFTFTVEVYYLDGISQDITASLTIQRGKTPSNDLLVIHAATEAVSGLAKGAFQLKVTGSDAITDDVVMWSDVMCSTDGETDIQFNIVDGGQNSILIEADIIDGGQNEV